MNKKLVKEFLIITFVLMIVLWVPCAFLSQTLDLTMDNILISSLMYIGGISPMVASFISLKRNNKVENIKEWFLNIFKFKNKIYSCFLMILFLIIYFLVGCVFNISDINPIVIPFIINLPLLFLFSLYEEVGWRMTLQVELEKKYNFHISTIFVAIIWWLWHLPIFFIKGTANSNMNYFLFGMMCVTLSYALGTLRKVSKGVFPCILAHALINGLSGIFIFNFSWTSCIVTLIATIVSSILILKY